ncbi:hypothetical protein BD560DRAFT_429921 [Blakeslea trispora]|nr:hypothetical protein BD560DRAFT_429921 [Blakeslea trispora]
MFRRSAVELGVVTRKGKPEAAWKSMVNVLHSFVELTQCREDEKQEDNEGSEDGDGENDTEPILYKIKKKCKKTSNKDGLVLCNVAHRFLIKSMFKSGRTEETFIDVCFLPFVECVFLDNSPYSYTRSSGKITLSNAEPSSSNGKDVCKSLMSDFCVFYEHNGNDVGLLAIEVKLPEARSSQVLSDRSKLALELKRMIDEQLQQGFKDPISYGILVEGYKCSVVACFLETCGIYVYAEQEEFSLMRNENDFGLLPNITLCLLRIRKGMDALINQANKRAKAESSATLIDKIKLTVELPLENLCYEYLCK